MRRAASLPWLSALWLHALPALAGVYIESAAVDTRNGASRPQQLLYVQDGAARIERAAKGPDAEYVIFRDDLLYVVEPQRKSYAVLDRETIRAVGGAVDEAMIRMRDELARLSPEQRAMVEQLMGEQAGAMLGEAGAGDPVTARDTGRSDAVSGLGCRVWELVREGTILRELCVVDFAEVPGHEDLKALAERMNAITRELSGTLSGLGVSPGDIEAMGSVPGYPVRIRSFSNGQPEPLETVLSEWREQSFSPALFVVPEGYARRDLPATGADRPSR